MTKDKRSFFERLTGSINISDETTDGITPASITPPSHKEKEKVLGNSDWLDDNAEEGELSVDVYQTSGEIVIQTMVAGVKPEDLTLSITREMVTIKGRRERPTEAPEDNYFQKELYWGAFSRTILLPHEVETEGAEAIERHGLLTIRLPKIDREKVQRIRVKSI